MRWPGLTAGVMVGLSCFLACMAYGVLYSTCFMAWPSCNPSICVLNLGCECRICCIDMCSMSSCNPYHLVDHACCLLDKLQQTTSWWTMASTTASFTLRSGSADSVDRHSSFNFWYCVPPTLTPVRPSLRHALTQHGTYNQQALLHAPPQERRVHTPAQKSLGCVPCRASA